MRRWLLVSLLFFMPLQVIWAAAAPYCTHESAAASKEHFGHHEHRHQAGAASAASAEEDGDGPAVSSVHVDCAVCHLGCAATLLPSTVVADAAPVSSALRKPVAGFRSHVPSGPERPDRIAQLAAARFGGHVVVGSRIV